VILEHLFGGAFGAAVAEAGRASTVGGAFLCGYQAALRALVPSLPPGHVCLCATEEGGGHPRAIHTTLTEAGGGWQLDGHKKWVTGADRAELLLVVASVGLDDSARNRLRVALVGARQPGVTLEPMPPTPFVPEISHAEVRFEAVFVSELLEGDGYDRYLKPFRTVEDTHVFASVLAYLVQRPGCPRQLAERILAVLATLEKISIGDPTSPELHLMLAGALALGRQIADEAAAFLDGDWTRDMALLGVAQKARQARTETAWNAATR
jgi:acyl-CoA dehydrogenase